MKITLIQMNSRNDKTANLQQAESLIVEAISQDHPDMIVLPEVFAFMGESIAARKAAAEEYHEQGKQGETCQWLQRLASQHRVFIHGGSICEYDQNQYFNTSFIFDPQGKLIARYRKIHLFDAMTPNGLNYKESDIISAGHEITTYQAQNVTIGCTICYDLRFGELFRALTHLGAQVIMVPSAFTIETGKAHWEILLRARAIETQCYIVAPGQTGSFTDNNIIKSTWGHSMIVDPWGGIVASLQQEIGHLTAEIDFDYLKKIRANLPVHQHRRLIGKP